MMASGRELLLRRRIRPRNAEADALCLAVREAMGLRQLAPASFPVELLARECLNNAVMHGGQTSAAIDFSLSVGRKWIRLQVSDGGPGFNWRKRSRKPADAGATSGRGLQICAAYARRIRFNRAGNQITLWIGKQI